PGAARSARGLRVRRGAGVPPTRVRRVRPRRGGGDTRDPNGSCLPAPDDAERAASLLHTGTDPRIRGSRPGAHAGAARDVEGDNAHGPVGAGQPGIRPAGGWRRGNQGPARTGGLRTPRPGGPSGDVSSGALRSLFGLDLPALEPGTPGDPGPFGPGTMIWAVGRERVLLAGGAAALLLQVAHPDRKSTRLNSSHVAISYAVFCLKKKN